MPNRSDWGCWLFQTQYSSALFRLLGFDVSGCAGKLPDASRRVGACLYLAQATGAGHQVPDQGPRSSWVRDPDPVGSDFLCLVKVLADSSLT